MIVIDDKPARLLPWEDALGRPCYLAGGGRGRVTAFADEAERKQMRYAELLIDLSDGMIEDESCERADLADLGTCLTAALRDLHRIARSRGSRLDHYLTQELEAESPEPDDPTASDEEEADDGDGSDDGEPSAG